MRTLEVLGYSYCNSEWLAPVPAADTPLPMIPEATELKAIVDLIEACEALWGPLDRDAPEGKG